jgi:pimeloyl-ACP methyl ester carboxylesterase
MSAKKVSRKAATKAKPKAKAKAKPKAKAQPKAKASAKPASVNPMKPIPVPQQVPVKEGMATMPDGGRLFYRDTGGKGPVVLFSHPASQSALIWLYQMPVFVKAGYRVVAYSRRSYYGSDPVNADNPGFAADDMYNVTEYLGINKFHGVGCAAGGGVLAQFAVSYPEKLLSVTISSNSFSVSEGYIADIADRVRPHETWEELPRWFRELGPSYRAANEEGQKLWDELEEKSGGRTAGRQKAKNKITPQTLEGLKLPVLMMGGDCDMSTPSSLLRMSASHIKNCEVRIIYEAGHSPYWEQPEIFNSTILNFIKKHRK